MCILMDVHILMNDQKRATGHLAQTGFGVGEENGGER